MKCETGFVLCDPCAWARRDFMQADDHGQPVPVEDVMGQYP